MPRRFKDGQSADIAVGHSLERVKKRDFAVFHDVTLKDATADKVLVGHKGVFALSVLVHPKGRRARTLELRATYDGKTIAFPDGCHHAVTGPAIERAEAVARHLSARIGRPIKVCPVLVVPGWDLACAVQPTFPVVNERNIDMVTQWSHPNAYLLDEEEQAIHEYLCGCCRDPQFKSA